MGQIARELASGPGWRASDVVCTAGPHAPVEEERHDGICIAAVLSGTFQYRGSAGTALMSPGSLLLGNDGDCFECGHAHGTGDHCISFHISPAVLEAIAAAMPGTKQARFRSPKLPPSRGLVSLFAEAAAAREACDGDAFEELAWRFAGAALDAGAGSGGLRGRLEEERAVELAARKIETDAFELGSTALSLGTLAQRAGMDAYRFLRLFRRFVGMTPHQYVLYLRLCRAAEWLISRDDEISTIAYDAGFNDLSTFNHRFRRQMGVTPGAYRARATRRV